MLTHTCKLCTDLDWITMADFLQVFCIFQHCTFIRTGGLPLVIAVFLIAACGLLELLCSPYINVTQFVGIILKLTFLRKHIMFQELF